MLTLYLALYRVAQQGDLVHYRMQLDGDFAQLLRACAEYMLARGTAGPPLLQRDPPNALFEQAGSLGTGSLDPAAIAHESGAVASEHGAPSPLARRV